MLEGTTPSHIEWIILNIYPNGIVHIRVMINASNLKEKAALEDPVAEDVKAGAQGGMVVVMGDA